MAKTFEQIEAEVKEKDQRAQDFVDMAKKNAEFARYEEARKQDKQIRKEMLLMYKAYAEEDPEYRPIFEKLQRLADYDVTAGDDYEAESDLYKELCEDMEKYDDLLNKKEEALNKEAKMRLKIEKNGEMVWATEEEKMANPAMLQADIQISKEQNKIDNMRRLNADIWHYFELQRDGHLQVPQGERVIDSVGKTFGMADYDYGFFVRTAMEMGFQRNNKERPLFPHEPNQNDVRQGLVGDCFYLATIANIARLNPDFIKQSMRDNQDGTVTVRLFSKSRQGEYKPVYVRVSKEIDSYGGLLTGGGENCVWLNCFERALAASGLYSMPKQGRNYWEPVPENIEEIYKDLKAKKDRGELTGNALDRAVNDYPWLFKNTAKNGKDLLPWPNFNSISGGNGGIAAEMLLGPDYKRMRMKMPNGFSEGYIKNVPQNAFQMLVLGNINNAKDLSVKKFEDPIKTFDCGSNSDEAFENMWAALHEDPKDSEWIKIDKAQFKDLMLRVATGLETYAIEKFGDASPENIIKAARKYTLNDGSMSKDVKNTYTVLRKNMLRTAYKMTNSRYSEAEEKVYAVIKECEMKHLPMTCSSPSKSLVAENHAYSILGAYEGTDGRKYIRVRNPWGQSRMSTGLETTFDAQGNVTHEWKKVEEGVFDVELSEWSTFFYSADFSGYEKDDVVIPANRSDNVGWTGDAASLKNKEYMFHEIIKRIAISEKIDLSGCLPPGQVGLGQNDFVKLIHGAVINNLKKRDQLPTDETEKRNLEDGVREAANSAYESISNVLDQYYQNPANAGKTTEAVINDIKSLFYDKLVEAQDTYMASTDNEEIKGVAFRCFVAADYCLGRMVDALRTGSFARDCAAVTGTFNRLNDILQRIDPANPAQRIYTETVGGEFNPNMQRPYVKAVFKDEHDVMKIRLVNWSGDEETMVFNEFYQQTKNFYFKDIRPEVLQGLIGPGDPVTQAAQAAVQQGLQEPANPMERKPKAGTFRDYLKALDDVDKILAGSKGVLDGSSDEFNNLREKLKEVRKEVVQVNGKNFGKLAETMGKLEPELAAYDQRCEAAPKNNWRRQMRTQACDMLKDLIHSAREAETQPLRSVETEYTKKMISQIYRSKGQEPPVERLDELAGRMMGDKYFNAFLKNQNAYNLKHATPNDITKGIEKLNKAQEKNIQKNEVNFEAKAMSM